jgi:hypothetical protein
MAVNCLNLGPSLAGRICSLNIPFHTPGKDRMVIASESRKYGGQTMFEQGIRLRHCENCSGLARFEEQGSYPDGSQRMICTGCQVSGGVLHRCHPFTQTEWLPLLLLGIDIVCPKCKAAYDLGVKIEPALPDLGVALQVVGVVAGSIVLGRVIVEIAERLREG